MARLRLHIILKLNSPPRSAAARRPVDQTTTETTTSRSLLVSRTLMKADAEKAGGFVVVHRRANVSIHLEPTLPLRPGT